MFKSMGLISRLKKVYDDSKAGRLRCKISVSNKERDCRLKLIEGRDGSYTVKVLSDNGTEEYFTLYLSNN